VTSIGELVTASLVSSSPILVTLMEAPEDTIIHSHRRENLKSYMLFLLSVLFHFSSLFSSVSFFVEK
jgi:hypothetical protein